MSTVDVVDLEAGDVVRDPEAHRGRLGINVPGPSAWARVISVTDDGHDSEVAFAYEYLEGPRAGQQDVASYEYDTSLELR